MTHEKAGVKYTTKVHRDGVGIWHQELWSAPRGRFYIEHSIEDGDYLLGLRGNVQHPLSFTSLQELEEFTRFISLAIFDSVVMKIPRERRRKSVQPS